MLQCISKMDQKFYCQSKENLCTYRFLLLHAQVPVLQRKSSLQEGGWYIFHARDCDSNQSTGMKVYNLEGETKIYYWQSFRLP